MNITVVSRLKAQQEKDKAKELYRNEILLSLRTFFKNPNIIFRSRDTNTVNLALTDTFGQKVPLGFDVNVSITYYGSCICIDFRNLTDEKYANEFAKLIGKHKACERITVNIN